MARPRLVVGALAVVLLAGCAQEPGNPAPGAAPVPSASSRQPEAPVGTPVPPPADELSSGSARHTIRSRGMVIDVVYTADTPARWSADGGTPVQMDVTVRGRNQKIYLTRATMRFVVSDGAGALPGPDPLVDSANITPGYLVTEPSSYVQSFTVPPVDRTATGLTMIAKLELVSLVDKGARDYSKLTVTDTVTSAVTP